MNLPLFVIIPLFTAFLITLIAGKKDIWGVVLSLSATGALTVLAVIGFSRVSGETVIYEVGGWPAPIGIVMVLDALSAFMLIIVSGVAVTALLYSIQYIRHLSANWKYYALFMLMLSGMNGVIITGDLFNLYVFMEIALLAAFALVAYGSRAREFEAAFKYAIMGSVSSMLILIGIGVTYSATSTLTLAKVAQVLPEQPAQLIVWLAAFFLAGFGLKAAMVPFHAWLPDAHSSAPAPISSMLSGVLIKVLGIYVIIRLFFNVFNAPPVLLSVLTVLGIISIVAAGLVSILQWDLKRLLAYSSISQIGYILLGLGLGTPLAILGAVFHLFNHAVFKSLLFYNAGSIELSMGTRNLKSMGRLTERLPVTSGTSMIASLAISGIPPFNGFFSKLIIIMAAVAAGKFWLSALAIIGSVLTLAAVLKFQQYSRRRSVEVESTGETTGLAMNTAMLALALICIIGGCLLLPGIKEFTLEPVVNVISGKLQYIQLVLGRSL
ncbi:MAG: proton-conducting transporter membrane subunit [candidate division KSB1 bacterium]|nr:proton-conducting transporter membrane subunit [candidate division KSB1 bacterium]